MTTATKRRPTSRTERSNRVAEMSARLQVFAESLDPAEQAAYAARFDHYSPRNAMLIVMQDPDATVVHGYDDWRKHGRHVRKGEHSHISILAPAGQRTERRDDTQGDDAGAERTHRFFKLVPVFDIRQTDPDDTTEETAA